MGWEGTIQQHGVVAYLIWRSNCDNEADTVFHTTQGARPTHLVPRQEVGDFNDPTCARLALAICNNGS